MINKEICNELLTDVEGGGAVSLRCNANSNHTMHVSCFIKCILLLISINIYTYNYKIIYYFEKIKVVRTGLNPLKCPACRTVVPAPPLDKPVVSPFSDSIDPVLLLTLKSIAKCIIDFLFNFILFCYYYCYFLKKFRYGGRG